MVNTMEWNERSDPDMRTANFCDVYREGVYSVFEPYYSKGLELICCGNYTVPVVMLTTIVI